MSDSGSRPDFGDLTRNGDAALAQRVRALRLDGRPSVKREGGGNTWLPWVLCLILAGTWASVGIRSYKSGGLNLGSPQTSPPSVTAVTPSTQSPSPSVSDTPTVATGESVLVAKGYIIPAHQISVSPVEVIGRIVQLNIEEGKFFKQGEVLAVIDSTSYQADYDEAVAQYNLAKARLEELENGPREEEIKQLRADIDEARAMLKQYTAEYQRNRDLRSATTQRDTEVAEANYSVGQARVKRLEQTLALLWPRVERKDQARAELASADARVARAKFRLDNCQIRAPVAGTILSKKAEIGNLINPVVGGLSTSLCDMADLSDMEVDLEIQERDIAKLFEGMACEIRADAYKSRKYDGYLDRIMPMAKRGGGVIPVRVKVKVTADEQGKYLKTDMGAEVTFLNKKAK